jgi:hypothetical protein
MSANNIPVFELNKDSYILKHKLNYNTSNTGEFSGLTYGILFTDYDIARKTQSTNAENFSGITINEDINTLSAITMTYYDQTYKLEISNHYKYQNLIKINNTIGTSINNTLYNNRKYQEYYDGDNTSIIQVNDVLNVYFDMKSGTIVNTTWEHFGPSGETWVLTGTTNNQIPWQVTGTTTIDGYSSSSVTFTVEDNFPILKYRAKVIEVGTNYIKLEKKLEDYYYNNIIKIASGTSYQNVYYTLESLDFSDKSYYGIKYILEENVLSKYFSISATNNQITIQPIPNNENLYFDYDNVKIITTNTSNNNTTYTFNTTNLYTKYKLDSFLYQLTDSGGTSIYNSGTSIYIDHNAPVTSLPINTGETYFNVILTNSGDTEYFLPYTYIYAYGLTNHLCLIVDISGTTITVMSPRTGTTTDEIITSINNLYTIKDISYLLYKCYVNIENLYIEQNNIDSQFRKLGVQIKKNIYKTYAGIFENLVDNQHIRDILTGIFFENENNVFTLKLYRPANFIDKRLTYVPIEITKIGKNRKTSIPVRVYNLTTGDDFNVLDFNIYDDGIYDSDIYFSELIFDSNED